METHTLRAVTQGRYLVAPATDEPPVGLLVGFHGYGETAERHLDEMSRIPGAERWQCVSVFALHRFYNTRTNEVVGCWMTKLDRELAIADNIAYVTDVLDGVKAAGPPVDRLVFCGFSQGVAMAYRAAARAGHTCDGIIALGGDLPPELRDDGSIRLPPVLIGRGTTDQWYSADKLEEDLAALARLSAGTQAMVYEGGHEWTPGFRDRAGRFLTQVAGS